MEYRDAKKILNERIKTLKAEEIDTVYSYDRVLAEDLVSDKDVPAFNRSPLDGYCFNYEDTIGASTDNPIYFDIIEEVPCGEVATKKIGKNQTIKVLTGAKLPDNANCVIKYEDISVDSGKLKLCFELQNNQNVILAGEDVRKGYVIAKKGQKIDMGVVGIAASLGMKKIKVYKKVKIGFISTGTELLEVDDEIKDGKIYNSNRYIFDAIFKKQGIESTYYGIVDDNIDRLKDVYSLASAENDIVISTGGVSVGDYDLVEKALSELGFNIFIDRIDMKPGMACCFAEKDDKLIFALSGNPMASVTTFYAVCLPAIKKMMGYADYENKFFKVKLKNSFNKKIGKLRFLRAKMEIIDGVALATLNLDQGNIVIKSLIDCNCLLMAENDEVLTAGKYIDAMLL